MNFRTSAPCIAVAAVFAMAVLPISLVAAACARGVPIARAEDGAAIMKRAAAMEAEGKLEAAGDEYGRAATAFEAAGDLSRQADALKRSAAAFEKLADQATNGTKPAGGGHHPIVQATQRPPERRAAASGAADPAPKPLRLAPLGPRPGHVIGRAVFEDGRPVPKFTAWVAGYDGQVNVFPGTVPSLGTVEAAGGQYAIQTKDTFKHERPVAGTVVGVHAVAHIVFRGQNYDLEMHPLDGKTNGTDKGDFRGNSGPGVVRDFVLRMRGVRPGYSAAEDTQTRYPYVYYGGVVNLDGFFSSKPGVGYEDATSLSQAFKEGNVEVTLTPDGPLLDGSIGQPIVSSTPVAAFKLGGNWKLRMIRNVPLGIYTATARIVLPGGESRPLVMRPDIRSATQRTPGLSLNFAPSRFTGLISSPTLYLSQ